MISYTLCNIIFTNFPYKNPSNLHHFSHHHLTLSPPPSFYNNVFSSLAFHKKRLLWKIRDCMNDHGMVLRCKEARFVWVAFFVLKRKQTLNVLIYNKMRSFVPFCPFFAFTLCFWHQNNINKLKSLQNSGQSKFRII